jgi:hypothetical protein
MYRYKLANLFDTVLPESEVWGGTVLSVVLLSVLSTGQGGIAYKESDHSLGVHALSNVEFVVLEVTNDLLGEGSGVLLESGDSVGVGLL